MIWGRDPFYSLMFGPSIMICQPSSLRIVHSLLILRDGYSLRKVLQVEKGTLLVESTYIWRYIPKSKGS